MAVTTFQDLPLADREHAWDGDAAEKRVRRLADAEEQPSAKYRDAHVWYDADQKDEFGVLQAADRRLDRRSVEGRPPRRHGRRQRHAGFPRGVDLPKEDIDRVKSHLAKYYAKMGETTPWDR